MWEMLNAQTKEPHLLTQAQSKTEASIPRFDQPLLGSTCGDLQLPPSHSLGDFPSTSPHTRGLMYKAKFSKE